MAGATSACALAVTVRMRACGATTTIGFFAVTAGATTTATGEATAGGVATTASGGAGVVGAGSATGGTAATTSSGAWLRATVWAGTVIAMVAPMAVVASQATATPNQPMPRGRTKNRASRSRSSSCARVGAATQGAGRATDAG